MIQAVSLVLLVIPAADSAVAGMPKRYADYPAYVEGSKRQDDACEEYVRKEIDGHRSASADRSALDLKLAGRWDGRAVPATYVMYSLATAIRGETVSGVAICTFAAGSKSVSEAAIRFDESIFPVSSMHRGDGSYQVLTNFLLVPERGAAVEEQR